MIDIAEPENEEQKDFMQNNSTSAGGTISDPTPRHPLPPQLFNDDTYCGVIKDSFSLLKHFLRGFLIAISGVKLAPGINNSK